MTTLLCNFTAKQTALSDKESRKITDLLAGSGSIGNKIMLWGKKKNYCVNAGD